jgi:hypothetical protein
MNNLAYFILLLWSRNYCALDTYSTTFCAPAHTGAPAYLSFPHFYQADPALLDAVEGLKPEKEKHQTYFLIQPVSSRMNLICYHSTECPKSLEPMGILIIGSMTFPHRWIGRRGPVEWAPRSPDLNTLDFAFWGFLKAQVYAVKIRALCYLRQRITDSCAIVDPNMLSKICTNMVKGLRKCV